MKCPLLTIASCIAYPDKNIMWTDCLKAECAWWDINSNGCSVYLISRSLMVIVDIGVDIKEKMLVARE